MGDQKVVVANRTFHHDVDQSTGSVGLHLRQLVQKIQKGEQSHQSEGKEGLSVRGDVQRKRYRVKSADRVWPPIWRSHLP